MHTYLAVTDDTWFRFLRAKPALDEINFWQPGGRSQFRALRSGEPFLFKLHAPENFVVGGGFFATSSILPASLVWETFGESNGASSYAEMLARIQKYRRTPLPPHEDPHIGCIILVQPFFFEKTDWIPMPRDWSLNIVQGKGYDTTTGIGAELWEQVRMRWLAEPPDVQANRLGEPRVFGDPVLMRPRLGQGSFRVLVTDTYQRHCAVTGEKALPVLDAAHVRGVAEGGPHRIDNGLLLRTDLHRLFDQGYVTVTPDHRFRVSHRLKTDYDPVSLTAVASPITPSTAARSGSPRSPATARAASFSSGTRTRCFGGEGAAVLRTFRALEIGVVGDPELKLGAVFLSAFGATGQDARRWLFIHYSERPIAGQTATRPLYSAQRKSSATRSFNRAAPGRLSGHVPRAAHIINRRPRRVL